MTSFLEGFGLWIAYTLGMGIYLVIVLVIVCGPMVLLYAAVAVLANRIARLVRRRPPPPE